MDVYGKIIWYIQQSLYRGKTPDDDGYYKFSRKELYEGAELSPSAFDSNKSCVIRFFSSEKGFFTQKTDQTEFSTLFGTSYHF